MRASDLLGRSIRLQDGPPRGSMASIRLDAVIVSKRHCGSYLGFQDRDQQGPWLLGLIVRRFHRGTLVVAWDEVRDQLLPDSRQADDSPPG